MILFSIIIFAPPLIISILLILKPLQYFNLLDKFGPISQKRDYVTFWSSGFGFNEVKEYIQTLAINSPIMVGVRMDAGIPENAVIAYFQESKNVFVNYLDSPYIPNFKSYECLQSKYPIYFISRDNNYAGLDKYLVELKRVYKPEGQHYIAIHQVRINNCQGKKTLILSK
jgi:hypothetical protein